MKKVMIFEQAELPYVYGVEYVRIDCRMESFFKTESGWFDLNKEIEVE